MTTRIRTFSLLRYLEAALALAEYERDEGGVIVASVPDVPGFHSQGDSFEEARANLLDAIEGNVLLALQLNLPIPPLPGVVIMEQSLSSGSI